MYICADDTVTKYRPNLKKCYALQSRSLRQNPGGAVGGGGGGLRTCIPQYLDEMNHFTSLSSPLPPYPPHATALHFTVSYAMNVF